MICLHDVSEACTQIQFVFQRGWFWTPTPSTHLCVPKNILNQINDIKTFFVQRQLFENSLSPFCLSIGMGYSSINRMKPKCPAQKKVNKNLREDIKCAPHIDSGDARLAGGGNMGLLSCATASDLQSARKSPPWEFWVFLANCSWCRWCVWACKSHNLAAAWNSQFCICCFISEQDLLIKHFVFPVSLNRGDAGFV